MHPKIKQLLQVALSLGIALWIFWFLYRDISEIYFEQKEYSKAWKLAVEATYYGNEPHFLIGLFFPGGLWGHYWGWRAVQAGYKAASFLMVRFLTSPTVL